MDTVQNISNIIGRAPGGGDPRSLHQQLPMVHPTIIEADANADLKLAQAASLQASGGPGGSGAAGGGSRRGNVNAVVSRETRASRRDFLSRPNWLFTHNENVLFCTALAHLCFPDQNNVPRKFIEEWFQEHMVSLDTMWPAGQRYIDESVKDMEKNPERAKERQLKELNTRRRNIFKIRRAQLAQAENAYHSANTLEDKEAAFTKLQLAQEEAAVPESQIPAQEPDFREVALVELGIKITRRLQGQTDRMDMAEELLKEKFIDDVNGYYSGLLAGVLKAIEEKHAEIAIDRERVETKSKQSRKRRRQQVANGSTVSGSATRVRFTNREIAMLIHWIYSYSKNEWAHRIYEFYIAAGLARSAEHVRDKMRDLIARSRESARGGLTSMKVKSVGGFSAKQSESREARELAEHDLADFKYPEGPLEYVPGGRYFNEERGVWLNGPLPASYINRYHDEVTRVMRVVQAKVERSFGPDEAAVQGLGPQYSAAAASAAAAAARQAPPQLRNDVQLQYQQLQHMQQFPPPAHIASAVQQAAHAAARQAAAQNHSLFEDAFVTHAQMQSHQPHGHPQNFASEDDFNLVSIWNENNKDSNQDDATAMAEAALKPVVSHDYFLDIDEKGLKRRK